MAANAHWTFAFGMVQIPASIYKKTLPYGCAVFGGSERDLSAFSFGKVKKPPVFELVAANVRRTFAFRWVQIPTSVHKKTLPYGCTKLGGSERDLIAFSFGKVKKPPVFELVAANVRRTFAFKMVQIPLQSNMPQKSTTRRVVLFCGGVRGI